MSVLGQESSLHGAHEWDANQANKNESRWHALSFHLKKCAPGVSRCFAVPSTIARNGDELAATRVHRVCHIAACASIVLTLVGDVFDVFMVSGESCGDLIVCWVGI